MLTAFSTFSIERDDFCFCHTFSRKFRRCEFLAEKVGFRCFFGRTEKAAVIFLQANRKPEKVRLGGPSESNKLHESATDIGSSVVTRAPWTDTCGGFSGDYDCKTFRVHPLMRGRFVHRTREGRDVGRDLTSAALHRGVWRHHRIPQLDTPPHESSQHRGEDIGNVRLAGQYSVLADT